MKVKGMFFSVCLSVLVLFVIPCIAKDLILGVEDRTGTGYSRDVYIEVDLSQVNIPNGKLFAKGRNSQDLDGNWITLNTFNDQDGSMYVVVPGWSIGEEFRFSYGKIDLNDNSLHYVDPAGSRFEKCDDPSNRNTCYFVIPIGVSEIYVEDKSKSGNKRIFEITISKSNLSGNVYVVGGDNSSWGEVSHSDNGVGTVSFTVNDWNINSDETFRFSYGIGGAWISSEGSKYKYCEDDNDCHFGIRLGDYKYVNLTPIIMMLL